MSQPETPSTSQSVQPVPVQALRSAQANQSAWSPPAIQARAAQSVRPDQPETRAKALEALMVEKKLATSDALDAVERLYAEELGPAQGGRVVARAWLDPAYRQRLLVDGTAAVAEFGFLGAQGQQIVAVENTPRVHNLVVCTLCSCYPWPLLGLPPAWYKSHAYRARAVLEPRAVLREFGLELDDAVEVRVWDSSAEVRYLVLPERPAGTEGLREEDLVALVTRDAMVGIARARPHTAVADAAP